MERVDGATAPRPAQKQVCYLKITVNPTNKKERVEYNIVVGVQLD